MFFFFQATVPAYYLSTSLICLRAFSLTYRLRSVLHYYSYFSQISSRAANNLCWSQQKVIVGIQATVRSPLPSPVIDGWQPMKSFNFTNTPEIQLSMTVTLLAMLNYNIHLYTSILSFSFPFSALTPLVGRQEGHAACKNWMLVCWWWWFDWSFAQLIAPVVQLSPPPPSSFASINTG